MYKKKLPNVSNQQGKFHGDIYIYIFFLPYLPVVSPKKKKQ